MSMEHKAFLFDIKKFEDEIFVVLEHIIYDGINYAKEYISNHYNQLKSPYTGDLLSNTWQEELDSIGLIRRILHYTMTLSIKH